MPGNDYVYSSGNLKEIPYIELDLSGKWQEFDNRHELTDSGLEKFAADWNSLIK